METLQLCYQLKINLSNYKLKDGNTTAMKLAIRKMQIGKYWEHDSNITNNEGRTVAMLMAKNGIVPEK